MNNKSFKTITEKSMIVANTTINTSNNNILHNNSKDQCSIQSPTKNTNISYM